MKFCRNCKVKVNEQSQYCPLCGTFLDETVLDENNQQIQRYIKHPPLKIEGKTKNYLQKRLFWFAFLIFVVCVVANFLTFNGSFWSGYVLCGLLMCYFVISTSVYRVRRLYSLIGLTTVVVCICAFGVDATFSLGKVGNLSAISFSIQYVMPWVVIGAQILTDVMIISNRNKYKYYFVSLIETTFIGVLIQVIVWLAKLQYTNGWFIPICFYFSVFNFVLMMVIFWRTFKQEMLRKFNI